MLLRPKEARAIESLVTRPTIARATRRRRLAILVVAALAALTVLGTVPGPVGASTASNMASQILTSMNRDRTARGLRPYRSWTALSSLAADRAARMASTNTMSHTAAGGSVGTALTSAGIQWYMFGEAIGETGYPWGSQAASNLYSMWKGSSPHRALMMSADFNYVGIGLAYRSSNRTTWASIIFAESRDHTGASARNGSLAARSTTITFAWSGHDPLLQSHMSGLRSFDLQYRIDGGTWRTIRNDTTATSITLTNRPRGHTYSFRVQAADRRGNLGGWTSTAKVSIP
ncbi:MAG: CAP domain-containing protein [Candidatus Limnocylindrales bacterium]